MSKPFKYIDLFAGCGGLSLGLEAAGFELEMAVEKSDMAAETFYHNLINRIPSKKFWDDYAAEHSSIEVQAKNKLIVKELRELLDNKKILKSLKSNDIDLIAGGPPCQGFSLAGRRNPDDIRNQLPWQFIELVEHINPKMVLIDPLFLKSLPKYEIRSGVAEMLKHGLIKDAEYWKRLSDLKSLNLYDL